MKTPPFPSNLLSCEQAWPTFLDTVSSETNVPVHCNASMTFTTADAAEFPKGHLHDWRTISASERRATQVERRTSTRTTLRQSHIPLDDEVDYLDVQCGSNHNYWTRFVPNEAIRSKIASWTNKTEHVSIVSFHLDSLSYAHAGRLLSQLRHTLSQLRTHVFTELPGFNALGAATALNMIPIVSGEKFHDPHNDRTTVHWLTQSLSETLWDTANARRYVTSVGGSNGNGLFGSRTLCTRCDHRPPVLPHWDHAWVKTAFRSPSGQASEQCDGNRNVMQHALDYLNGLFHFVPDHVPIFAHMSFMDQHAGNPWWALHASEQRLISFVTSLLQRRKNVAIVLYGDHGRPYDFLSKEESFFEENNPYLAFVLPLTTHSSTLKQNRQRIVSPYDLHATFRGLLGVRTLHGVDLRRDVVPSERSCPDANIPTQYCLSSAGKSAPSPHQNIIDVVTKALDSTVNENITPPCRRLTVSTARRLPIRGVRRIEFVTNEGPTLWELTEQERPKQISQWDVFTECVPPNTPRNECVCTERTRAPMHFAHSTVRHNVVFGIPTIARKGHPEYLKRTLTSMKQHGVDMEAVYVLRGNNKRHTVYDSVRSMGLHVVVPASGDVNIDYSPSRLNDGQVQMAFDDSTHQKYWRISEARDWMHLMSTLYRNTDAKYIGINQDDGEWTSMAPLFDAPITSLWSRGNGTHCKNAWCGMVSVVFERNTLHQFLDWLAIDDHWKEKPIDWSLNDFVKQYGLNIPIHKIVRHIGTIRSISTIQSEPRPL